MRLAVGLALRYNEILLELCRSVSTGDFPMAYVAVKGGEEAIAQAEALLRDRRRGQASVPDLTLPQIEQQLSLGVDRVMAEGSLYDRTLAALAIKQSWGDLIEAIFLLRAYRTTLPRFYYSQPLNTSTMQVQRRISAIFKDVPGGQQLGATFDYIPRLLDFNLAVESAGESASGRSGGGRSSGETSEPTIVPTHSDMAAEPDPEDLLQALSRATPFLPPVLHNLAMEGLLEPEHPQGDTPFDLTRQPLQLPADRSARLQNLARGDEGFLLSMAYSTQRGYGKNHPFAGEIRVGTVEVVICPEELGFEVTIAEILVTEVQMVNQFQGGEEHPPQFTQGYGLTFGYTERKAMAMALVDRALRSQELGEPIAGAAQDEEFVLLHSDNVEAQGFVQHLKLPHYVDFQSELHLIRQLRLQHPE